MSHLPFAIVAYFLNAVAVTINKFLLVRHIPDPLVYIFYFSLVSLIALAALPFTSIPPPFPLFLASISTLLWTTGAYFMFKALQKGHVARVIPIIGTLIPLVLLGHAITEETVKIDEVWAVITLILGLIFLTLPDWKVGISKKEVFYEIASSILFAYSYILIRQAFLQHDYTSVFIWSRIILLPLGLVIVLVPSLRKRILSGNNNPNFKLISFAGLLFIASQIAGGSSELLIIFSVALANPAVVNSLQGTQYIFLFVFSLMLARKYPQIFKESFSKLNLLGKLFGIILIGFGLYILSFTDFAKPKVEFGVSFSPRYAQSLELNPEQTFVDMLDNLNVKLVRLPVYWDEVEKVKGQKDFSKLDFYLQESLKKDVKVVLVVGFKQPRWPECFTPQWAANLSRTDKNEQILKLVNEEINYFKKYPNIIYWQVENEPFVPFGLCIPPDDISSKLLEQEINTVKSLDDRKIMVTDSGELSTWIQARKRADILGTTFYKTVWNPYFGLVDYPFPSVFYSLKANISKFIAGKLKQEILISELQAEPWITGHQSVKDVPIDQLTKQFSVSKFSKNITFVKDIGFDKALLWGVEWWYFMKENGRPEYLEYAKTLF
ncbi:DMT family transporter [Candidatus Daviesbacteria bacterium]|nr:DMT family transporter [Candidatus Daviesbacteria bacterium]